jgi:hypothetical protein
MAGLTGLVIHRSLSALALLHNVFMPVSPTAWHTAHRMQTTSGQLRDKEQERHHYETEEQRSSPKTCAPSNGCKTTRIFAHKNPAGEAISPCCRSAPLITSETAISAALARRPPVRFSHSNHISELSSIWASHDPLAPELGHGSLARRNARVHFYHILFENTPSLSVRWAAP